MVGKVVVVFDGLEGGGFAEETQMMYRHGFREQGLKR